MIIFVALLGLAIGSFLNVVIHRIPAGASLSLPPSSCGSCSTRIRARDNIPVLSWLILRGKCRDCAAPISIRYLLVEVGTTVFFVAVALRFGVQGLRVETSASVIVMVVAFLYFASISVALAVIDLETHTLPDRIVLSAYPIAAIVVGAAAVVSGEPECLFWALLGGLALFLLYFLMAALYPKGMGLGDVKLAGVIGIFLGVLGVGPLIVGAFGAFVLGGLFSLVLLATGRAGRGSGIPFGPWMLAGAWLGVFAGEPIATGYLNLVGLN